MQRFIVCFEGDALAPVSWLQLDADGQIESAGQGVLDAGLAKLAQGSKLVVLLPEQTCLHTKVELPEMSASRMQQALPFALEEGLLDDPEKLHFAIADKQSDGKRPVVVIARQVLQQYLVALKQFGMQPDVVMPIGLALPYDAATWHGFIQQDVIVRNGEWQVFDCAVSDLPSYLALATESNEAVTDLVLYVDEHVQLELPDLEFIKIQLKQSKIADRLAVLLPQLESPSINLLQAEFAGKKKKTGSDQSLQKVLIGSAVCFVVALLLYPLVSQILLQKRFDALNAQIATIYKKHFPNAKSVVAPKRRMQDKLGQLGSANTAGDQLFVLLAQIGQAKTSDIHLKQYRYQNNQLNLEVEARHSDALSKFSQALESKGLEVKQANVNVVANGVTANLEIK